MRGPLIEKKLLNEITQFDALLCGDDEITRNVIKKGALEGNLKAISKYGIGLDKIDIEAAKDYNIKITNCPGVNKTTVAEHVFALLLSFVKNIIKEDNLLKEGKWKRLIGSDLIGKTLGVLGTGNIGKEVIKRANAFGMNIIAFDKYPDNNFSKKFDFIYESSFKKFIKSCDFLTIHVLLNDSTRNLINEKSIKFFKKNCIIINTARAEIINHNIIIEALNNDQIGGYLSDVFPNEPLPNNDPIINAKNVVITPHIGSRTHENIVRQGTYAVQNLIKSINEYKQN